MPTQPRHPFTVLAAGALAILSSGSLAAAKAPKHYGSSIAQAPHAAAVPAPPAKHAGPFGSYCLTPMGRMGPGLVQPLGAPCSGKTSSGMVGGQTVE